MILKAVSPLASLFSLIPLLTGAHSAEWYVAPPPRGSDSNPGTEQQPFATIQKGIDTAVNGETVVVAEGTYMENIQFKGKNIVLSSTDPSERTVVQSTIIDGNKVNAVVTFAGDEDETCVLSGFTIRNGDNSTFGGGIHGGDNDQATRGTIENNIITANSSFWGGGVAFCHGTIQGNTITANSAYEAGGLGSCNGVIQNNVISGNSSSASGGIGYCHGMIRNNLITGNRAGRAGGIGDCHAAIANNTIVGNSANSAKPWGGGLFNCDGPILNCIIWGNTAGEGPQLHTSSQPTYSCIQDWIEGGEGNIALNPQFVDADGPDDDHETYVDNNFRLLPDSPCINAGKNEDWMWQAVDLDGDPRVVGGKVDMGAYEYGRFSIIGITWGPLGGVKIAWGAGAGRTYTVWKCSDLEAEPWNVLVTITPGSGLVTLTDPDTAHPRMFYRIETE